MQNDKSVGHGWVDASQPWWSDAESDPLYLAAAEWLARLQAVEVSRDDISGWLEWMHADARHAVAFDRIEEISSAVAALPRPPVPSAQVLSNDQYDGSIPLTKWHRPWLRRPKLAIAASIAVVAMIGGSLLITRGGWNDLTAQFASRGQAGTELTTEIGENRVIPLADGSNVTLGGRTSIKVELSKSIRTVWLQNGEAFFQVAKDPTRQFKVHVGGITLTAVGTAFNVNHDPERAVVTVAEGRVILESVGEPSRSRHEVQAVQLDAGTQVIADGDGISGAVAVNDLTSILSWRTGRLSFRQQPLRYVIRDANRYTQKTIDLADSSIGDIAITGTLTKENIPGWIASLERAFDLKAVEYPDRIMIQSSR